MRLLVSVRSAAEAVLAARHGVDIVDAKEPDAGPLGAVSRSALRDIHLALPPDVPLGVALGDANAPDQIGRLLDRVAPPVRVSGTFLKVGFAGACRVEEVAAVLRRVVERARELGPSVAVIAASYADYDQARSLSPEQVLDPAIEAGAAGALIDTWSKDGRGLLRHMSVDALGDWATRARRAGCSRQSPAVSRPTTSRFCGTSLRTWSASEEPRAGEAAPARSTPSGSSTSGRPSTGWPVRPSRRPPLANCQSRALLSRRAPTNDAIADRHGSCLRTAGMSRVAVPWVCSELVPGRKS
jgi:uncharacterized protein (UPF0264 family)